ncbi:MAG: hypothetical protein Q8K89_08505, partial [Actinomycetota bacterium]|nr:hypothetical protein [Actinomycetota bacterium]
PVWDWLGMGYTDSAAIALSAWTLVALIEATEHNAWLYLAVGPLYACAVLMRFTALLIAFPLVIWLLLRWRPFVDAPKIVGAIGLAVLTYLPAGLHYAKLFGDALFPFIFAFSINETITAPSGEGMVASSGWYYIREAPSMLLGGRLAPLGTLLLLTAVYGLVYAGLGRYLSETRPQARHLLFTAGALALALAAQLYAGLVLRQLTIPLALLVAWRELGPADDASDASSRTTARAVLDAAMFGWLLAHLDFHGHQQIQIPRYFITMAIPLLYLTLLGITQLSEMAAVLVHRTTGAQRYRTGARWLALLVPIGILIAIPVMRVFATSPEPDITAPEARASAEYLSSHTSSSASIVSDLWPITAFFMRAPVRALPQLASPQAIAHELEKQNATYYVKLHGGNPV